MTNTIANWTFVEPKNSSVSRPSEYFHQQPQSNFALTQSANPLMISDAGSHLINTIAHLADSNATRGVIIQQLEREANLRKSVEEQLEQHRVESEKQLEQHRAESEKHLEQQLANQAKFLKKSMIDQFKERAEIFTNQSSAKLAETEKNLADTLTALSDERIKFKAVEKKLEMLTKQLAGSVSMNDWRKNTPCRNGLACVATNCAFNHSTPSTINSSAAPFVPESLISTVPEKVDNIDTNIAEELDSMFPTI